MESRDDLDGLDGNKEKSTTSSYAQLNAALQASVNNSTDTSDPLKAAEQTGPRVYTLKNHNNKDVRFFVFGCHGDKHITTQKQVADFIKDIIQKHPELKPDFIILLGDNFYPNGVDAPDDKRFQTQFYDMYGIPCFIIPGNHDWGFAKEETINYSSYTSAGKARVMNQVAHSYKIHEGDPKLTTSIADFYRQPTLDLQQLPRWNMPWLYYSLIIGNLQLFFRDSNTFADDYLSMIDSVTPIDPKLNQAAWFIQEFKNCQTAGRTPIVFQHHPLVNLGSRRRYGEGDAKLYFKDVERWKKLAVLFGLDIYDYQYDMLVQKIDEKLNIKWAANFGAHVHAMYNYISPDIRQFIVGTGGGKLQDRAWFDKHENTGFFLKELGFMAFSCNKISPQIMNLNAFTVSNRQLSLTNASSRPVTLIQDKDTADLYKLVLEACNQHTKTLADLVAKADEANKPNIQSYPYIVAKSWNYKNEPSLYDVDGMHNIMAYLCQPRLEDFQLTLNRLDELMDKLKQKTNDTSSLFGRINQALKQSRFGKTVAELLDVNVAEATSSTAPSFT